MTPWHDQPEFSLWRGDARQILAAMPAASVHAVVCDPPYELGFMGKGWDSTGIANDVGLWREVLRVLKPGGHLVAFSGTRTYHRMACAIEDAGFEIRDQLAWVYGSGFPKSLDVSKAIDCADRIGFSRERALRFTAWMRGTGITSAQINEATGTVMASHYLTEKEQPAVATEELFSKLRPIILARGHKIPAEIEELVRWRTVESENMKRRPVLETRTMADLLNSRPVSAAAQGIEKVGRREVAVTAAHTPAAQEWEGWGTALKPAWEPICLARKPLIGPVAENVTNHRTGALNIDGCRIDGWKPQVTQGINTNPTSFKVAKEMRISGDSSEGRWPANLCHDGSPEVVAVFPAEATDADGSPARFFYCPKASTLDRDEGLQNADFMAQRIARSNGAQAAAGRSEDYGTAGDVGLNRIVSRRNIHPTVKPTELMRWLVRLVTPPQGTVLDWCNGSGSTGKACMLERVRFIGIDLDEEGAYQPIARARIAYALQHRDRWEQLHAAPAPAADTPGQLSIFGEDEVTA